MNFAKAINAGVSNRGAKAAETKAKSNEARKRRVARNLDQLRNNLFVTGYKNIDPDACDTDLNPAVWGVGRGKAVKMSAAQAAQKVFVLFKDGLTSEQILKYAPDLPERHEWINVADKLLEYAAERRVNPDEVVKVFGLGPVESEEPEDTEDTEGE